MSHRVIEDETIKRDLRLALEQKSQADRLVETLTKRCDALRLKLLEERQVSGKTVAELQLALEREREVRQGLELRTKELTDKANRLESDIEYQKRRNAELKKVSEAAMAETLEVMKAFSSRLS